MDARLAKVYENLPHEILAISGTFPFTLATHPFAQRPQGLLALLHQYLPSPEYATELRDHYFRYAVFMCVSSPSLLIQTDGATGSGQSRETSSMLGFMQPSTALRRPEQCLAQPTSRSRFTDWQCSLWSLR